MDHVLIIFAVMLFAVAIVEAAAVFLGIPSDCLPLYSEIVAVFAEDSDLALRLDCLSRSGCKQLILVDFSASAEQSELCRCFVHNNPDSVFISADELEENLRKIFTDTKK